MSLRSPRFRGAMGVVAAFLICVGATALAGVYTSGMTTFAGGTVPNATTFNQGVTFASTTSHVGAATYTSAAPQIQLNNGTSNWIQWPAVGATGPTFTTRSIGTKLVLFPNIDGTHTDYALGVEGGGMWFTAPALGFRFYGNNLTTLTNQLDGSGNVLVKIAAGLDTLAAGALNIGATNATSIVEGRAGQSWTLASIAQTAIPAKANNTIASATTIAPTALLTHITGTTTIQTITAPTPLAQTNGGGIAHLIFDGVAPWNAAGNIFVAGTPTTAGTTVTFIYDNATAKWYPSRTL